MLPCSSEEEGESAKKVEEEQDPEAPLKMDMSDEQMELQKKAQEYLKQKSTGDKGGKPGEISGLRGFQIITPK